MKSQEVIAHFIMGCDSGMSRTLYIHGNGLYSYDINYPLAARVGDKFLLNKEINQYPYQGVSNLRLLERRIGNRHRKVSKKVVQKYLE